MVSILKSFSRMDYSEPDREQSIEHRVAASVANSSCSREGRGRNFASHGAFPSDVVSRSHSEGGAVVQGRNVAGARHQEAAVRPSGQPEINECQEVLEVDFSGIKQEHPRSQNHPNCAHSCICKQEEASTEAKQVFSLVYFFHRTSPACVKLSRLV